MINNFFNQLVSKQFYTIFLVRWTIISFFVGSLSGSASAWFLIFLKWAGKCRNENIWIISLLPLAGFLVALSYKYLGKEVQKGNNQLIEEVQQPKKIIPFIMAPLVLVGTVITHLFGGSAGREGTAVQMGGSIADQLSRYVKFTQWERKVLIMCGISAGFASVFGTPMAGAIFALEIIFIRKIKYDAIIPVLMSAFIANYVCDLWPITHTHYQIASVPSFNFQNVSLVILASVLFGLVSVGFSVGMNLLSSVFKKHIKNMLFRPVIGGVIVASLGYLLGYKYLGLGVPTIVESFTKQQGGEVFAIKLILTVITLSAGFKGGEVTPLFYIGATLGSALSLVLPLPISLLAGVGFVAVFSGATNAPLACSIMGLELFGIEAGLFIFLACFVAFFVSGNTGIYSSQIIGRKKHPFLKSAVGNRLSEIMFSTK
jgi:H+/Cl- antiporter ClcA